MAKLRNSFVRENVLWRALGSFGLYAFGFSTSIYEVFYVLGPARCFKVAGFDI